MSSGLRDKKVSPAMVVAIVLNFALAIGLAVCIGYFYNEVKGLNNKLTQSNREVAKYAELSGIDTETVRDAIVEQYGAIEDGTITNENTRLVDTLRSGRYIYFQAWNLKLDYTADLLDFAYSYVPDAGEVAFTGRVTGAASVKDAEYPNYGSFLGNPYGLGKVRFMTNADYEQYTKTPNASGCSKIYANDEVTVCYTSPQSATTQNDDAMLQREVKAAGIIKDMLTNGWSKISE